MFTQAYYPISRFQRIETGLRLANVDDAVLSILERYDPRTGFVVADPVLVTDALPGGYDILACGPEPMLERLAEIAPSAQLAWEAPMACGYGACYGCVVELDGHYERLCVRGPVLRGKDALCCA